MFPLFILSSSEKILTLDVVLEPKKVFGPHQSANSQPRAQHSEVNSRVRYHSAIQAPQQSEFTCECGL